MSVPHRLQKGDLVLVTGVTGYVGSATAEALLSYGLRVRGTTRDLKKTTLLKEKVDKQFGLGRIEFVQVDHADQPGAYDQALEGTSGVIHVAVDLGDSLSSTPNPELAVKNVTAMTLGILESAQKVPTIKSVVICSSIVAVYFPHPGKDVKVTTKEFNDYTTELAFSVPADDPHKGHYSYVASKTRAEQALWGWVNRVKPSFAINAVLPAQVHGPICNPAPGFYTTGSFLSNLFKGEVEGNPIVQFLNPSTWHIDVRDVAILHLAALLASDVDHQRILGTANPPPHINDILGWWREAYPDHPVVPNFDFPDPPKQELVEEEVGLSIDLMKRYAGRGWIPLKQTVIDNVKAEAV